MSTFSDHLKGFKLNTDNLSDDARKELKGVGDKTRGLLGN